MAARKKVSKKSTVSRKKAAKKAVAKKKVSRKKTATKKKVARKKAAKKKAAKKKTSKKKVVKKKASKKKTSKKKVAKKKTSKKKVAKKKTAQKKTSKKKAKSKPADKKSGKTVSKKKTSKKKPAAKKATAKPATRKTAAKQDEESSAKKRKITVRTPPVKRPNRIATHTPINPADHLPTRPKRRKKVSDDQLIHGIAPYEVTKGEEYMNDDQIAHFREILGAWKSELMEEVDRTVHHMQDEASNFPDPNDRATQESEFGLELRTRDRERKLLKKIDQAIARLDDNSYGYCEETGEEIGLKRLEARPVATLCVEAQERREVAERQYRDQDDRYR